MAVQKKNKEIPQRKKDLLFGYVRNCEKEIKQNNVPMVIKYLCLGFWNVVGDEFDEKSTNSKISIFKDGINGINSIKLSDGDGSRKNVNSYLLNVMSSGIHIWTFKQSKYNDFDMIGIVNVKEHGSSLNLEGGFGNACDYALSLSSANGCEDDHTIEMTLNMTNPSLRWRINDDDVREIAIEKGEYRAAVSLYHDGGECVVTLLSYRHIV